MDNNGYVMSLSSFFLILPAVLLLTVLVDMTVDQTNIQQDILNSQDVMGVATDLEASLPLVGREVLRDKSLEVIHSGKPLSNSRKEVKEELQNRMDSFCSRYCGDGMLVECKILNVDNSFDPFCVEVKSRCTVNKGTLKHQVNLTQNISLVNGSFPIYDPLPFIKCRNYGGATIKGDRTYYGSSLENYLKSRGIENFEAYENATSALSIKKCPYDPYILHGDTDELVNLKNCIDNGFYHESSDGSCFLCRLEGRGTCPHYGMETFITPAPSDNTLFSNPLGNVSLSNNSSNAPSSVDHVIFNDTGSHGTYSGCRLIYFTNGTHNFQIYLDNSHRQKYGLPNF
ncbi:hypothetical protein A994_00975 [Methanobacterium formicicum DSM 3637]|uniref:Uncharacterized protein n=2 Tax=Methanobacterium formicicum TaxID=2162 RepID=K2RVP0_METFP|nr:hypothetical protein A994_00975 [Methanobacterium formicicum DSM 3637]